MDDFARNVEVARQELLPQWSDERSARLYAGTVQRGRRRVATRAGVSSLGAIAAIVWFSVGMPHASPNKSPSMSPESLAAAKVAPGSQAAADSGHTLRLADGSHADLVTAQTELEVAVNDPNRIRLRLLAGRAHFDVVPNHVRTFEVEAAPYRVEVIGTVFDVERTSSGVSVGVTRGKVRVYGPTGNEMVVAGQIRQFDVNAAAQAAEATVAPIVPAAEPIERAVTRARTGRRSGAASMPSWRSLSQSGQYDAAFKSLSSFPQSVVNDPATLMDAADAARLSGHPNDAVQYLQRVLNEHAASPVAPLAAFTLGRVYLDRLGQPDRAAEAFELARRLAPMGSLTQDALAREVEALSKGGNSQKAYLRAQEYLKAYPDGRRARAVQLYGGLE